MLDRYPQEVRDQPVDQGRLVGVGHLGAHRAGGEQGDVDAGVEQLAAQRLAEGVDERLGRGVGGVVGNGRVAGGRTGDQDAARLPGEHPGQHRQNQVVHTEDVERHLVALAGRIEPGDRPEGRGARVGAQDRDVPPGQFVGESGALLGVGEVDGAHLHRHPVVAVEPGGEFVEHLAPPRGDDQVVAAGGQFGGQRLADALGGAGDDGPGLRGGRGYGHGAIVGAWQHWLA